MIKVTEKALSCLSVNLLYVHSDLISFLNASVKDRKGFHLHDISVIVMAV